jgi:hypothetical protein
MEFGILAVDYGMAEFSGWERKMGLWTGKSGGCSLIFGFGHRIGRDYDSQKVYEISVS